MQFSKRKVVPIGIDFSVLALMIALSLLVITRFTGKAIPLVEEWSIYRRNVQFDAFIQTVLLQNQSLDIRYVFDGGMMSFLPINWLGFIFAPFGNTILELRFNMAINIAVIGYSGYLLLRFVGCNLYYSVLGGITLQGTFFSFASYTSTPRYLTIPLFTGCFILSAHPSLSNAQFIKRMIFLFAVFLTMASNAACLVVALLGVPIGALYALILPNHISKVEIVTRIKRILVSAILAILIFGPFLVIEIGRAKSQNLSISSGQQFELGRFLKSLLGRGFWWEYSSYDFVRYSPYVDAFDDVYVVLAGICLLLVPILYVRNFLYNLKINKSRKYELSKDLGESTNKVAFFMLFAGVFVFLSNLNSLPGWSKVVSGLRFLGIFREAFSKFNGVYGLMVIAACFLALQNYAASAWGSRSITRFWRNAHGYILSLTLLSLSMFYVVRDEFVFPINEPASISVSDYLSLKKIAVLIDNSSPKEESFCISYEGNGELTWIQASVTRVLMSQVERQSGDWRFWNTGAPTDLQQCNIDLLTISKNGKVDLKIRS